MSRRRSEVEKKRRVASDRLGRGERRNGGALELGLKRRDNGGSTLVFVWRKERMGISNAGQHAGVRGELRQDRGFC